MTTKKLTEKQVNLIKRSAHMPCCVQGEWRWGSNPGSVYTEDARVYRPLLRAGLIEGTYSFRVTQEGLKAAGLEEMAALAALVRFFGMFEVRPEARASIPKVFLFNSNS